MNKEQFALFMQAIDNQTNRILASFDEQAAIFTNVLHPSTYEPCSSCRRLTTKPYKSHMDDGDDFCSEECMTDYIERQRSDRIGEAVTIAEEKMKGIKGWDKFQDINEDGPSSPFKDIMIEGIDVEVIPSDEEKGGVETEDGWVEISYRTDDANYICSCSCNKCDKKFDIPAQKLLKSRKHPCPHCKSL